MKFLNKLCVKAVFSEAPELNVTARDMGEAMVSMSFTDDVIQRLKTATGTIGSMNIIVGVDVNISIVKTCPAIDAYMERIMSNGYIGGTLTLYDDINRQYEITDISLNVREVPSMNGTEPAVQFIVQGNLEVNKDGLSIVG